MNNETKMQKENETVEIDAQELEAIAATLSVRSRLRAGAVAACCSCRDCCNNH